ncbi:SSI family serine proteinase inhibitor [Streptomyces longisporoflavus]|uniref:SSI family serine proteinase inhibitor n=1 Tax=Streptomyces longisporoflavus TaxID=28044 RepID=UPI00167DCE1C|nr:SSI family serine proteinase inhibitor [Streptomyces longisporoflavus]
MLRRLVLTAAASLAALSAAPAVADAGPGPLPLPSQLTGATPDRLTVKVTDAGEGLNGTYELECHPTGGTHPRAQEACERLDQERWGRDAFAPTPADANCTMQYGGPATARITGTWHGRPVNATYDRKNGCEISRWNNMVPVLPEAGASGA